MQLYPLTRDRGTEAAPRPAGTIHSPRVTKSLPHRISLLGIAQKVKKSITNLYTCLKENPKLSAYEKEVKLASLERQKANRVQQMAESTRELSRTEASRSNIWVSILHTQHLFGRGICILLAPSSD